MDEYIRREDAIKCIEGQCVDGKMWGNEESEWTLIEAYSAIDNLMEIPPADVAPVVHGCWIEKPFLMRTSRFCSKCGDNFGMPHGVYRYCPNCGAKMDSE